jgi:hypothetical protein
VAFVFFVYDGGLVFLFYNPAETARGGCIDPCTENHVFCWRIIGHEI